MPVTVDGLPETAAPGDPGPPPGLVVVGRYDELPGYAVQRPRGADSWLFTWTVGGGGTLRQGRAETAAGAGDLVVLAPGTPHRYGVHQGARHWEFWWAHCGARPSWTAWLGPYARGDGLYVVTPDPSDDGSPARIEAAFRRMLADARRPGTGAPPATLSAEAGPAGERVAVAVAHGTTARELALCALEEVVLLTAGAAPATRTGTGVDPRVRRAQELIEADPGAPHTVRSLAAEVSLSPSRFAHLFTGELGRSPMRALHEARLHHAARLLESTDLSVERVAAASGFASPFHFNRVFRRRYGTPPGAYRAAGPMVGA
ncbi:helix-turn-helix domain-containing protein [Streptomyces sp. A2-16]|uniref:helix-turn-helix domain-containing protein n=1 Tax=Streptomyces sp. A2-16 TaxID=2781734 RepID=UPI001BB030EE|nr:helix-turn-helix domain-containing protein [Streptomyces sp. A2-16]QUC58409.1 helix-turn-helix domain-containing protein [Streptomyces sp. A2-16]